jgi:putative transposase
MTKTRTRRAGQESPTSSSENTTGTAVVLPLLTALQATRADLLGLCVESGFKTLEAMLEMDRERLCKARKNEQTSERVAFRGGTTRGSVVLGGRKVSVRIPRVRGAEGEIPLPTYQRFADHEVLDDRTLEQIVVGVSTRKYDRSLEAVGDVDESATSKSAVSRRFVAMTATDLAKFTAQSLGRLDLVAVMIDGLEFGDHMVVLGLGIDSKGKKHPLGLWEGSTENEAICTALLASLVSRGVKPDRTRLFVIDGSKALSKAVRKAYGDWALIQRCQVHKVRNVMEHLPEHLRSSVKAAMWQAYGAEKASIAKRLLNALARKLEPNHPGAAASLREGLAETLTVIELGLPDKLRRTLGNTNPIENLNSIVRLVTRNVKRWRSGSMVARWVGTALREATKSFRRVKGCNSMDRLVEVLNERDRVLNPRKEKAA